MHHLFGMDEHAIRHGVVVADDRVDEFVNERVRLEAETLCCVLQQRAGTRVLAIAKPGAQPIGNPSGARHACDAGRMRHHPRCFVQGKMTEREESAAHAQRSNSGCRGLR